VLNGRNDPYAEQFLSDLFPGEHTWMVQNTDCTTLTVATVPKARAITKCGVDGSIMVPKDTSTIDYTLTGNGKTGTNTVTAKAIAPAVLSAAPDIDQSVSVTYTNQAGETVDVSVDLPQVKCAEMVGVYSFTADADGDRTNGRDLLVQVPGPDAEVGTLISLALGDGLWFISGEDFEGDEKSFTLDGLEGTVSPAEYNNGVSDVGPSIDTAATATGSLECTTTD
jgi:hypothetical protein